MQTAIPFDQNLLTIRDVARLLRCSTRTVHRLKVTGQLPAAVRVRSLLRWRRSDIESFISRCMGVS
jgi:excisionase family DNA binding protein